MLRRATLSVRRFSTTSFYFEEHYQYPGNPTQEEFLSGMLDERKPLIQDSTVFKPKAQIEFNRVGELLLYEAEPYRSKEIYFPYPYCLGFLSIPWLSYMYLNNPLHLPWHVNNLVLGAAAMGWYPQVEYFFSLRYYIHRLWLLRGGKVLKIEHSNIAGTRFKSWIFVDEINLLTADHQRLEPEKGLNAKLLGEDGQLLSETHIQIDNFVDVGRNMENHVLKLCHDGTVHHPDILDAVLKGFEVDTSNFRINTLHVERWHEPNTNS